MVKGKGDFPNYLMNTSGNDETEAGGRQAHSSSFVAADMHGATPSVPFLREHKESFQRYQKENPEMRIRKDYVSEERVRLREERREKTTQSQTFYKSRRPFRATEIPSIWNANVREEKRTIDYEELKEQLHVDTADLILLDLNPPTEVKKKPIPRKEKANKALHRSLGLIMEQEQAHTWTKPKAVPVQTVTSGVKSFFDERHEH